MSDDQLEGVVRTTFRTTHRWRGISVLALVAFGVGVVAREPGVLLVAVLGVSYAAYARTGPFPEPRLAVERSIADTDPAVGDAVEVVVTVRNEGSGPLFDLRLVDGVPDALVVTDGSPRRATALRSGEETTIRYAVTAARGRHEFGPVQVIARDASGSFECELAIDAGGSVVCISTPTRTEPLALEDANTLFSGRVSTRTTGSGVEFSATRAYRPGDPLNKIDWNRMARTGELASVEFTPERAATVVLMLDARQEAYLSPIPTERHAVDKSIDGIGAVGVTLLAAGNEVGIAVLGPNDAWLSPSTGRVHEHRMRTMLATHRAFSSKPPDAHLLRYAWLRRFTQRFPSSGQLVIWTPLCDDGIVALVRRLAVRAPVTVVSPDPTTDETPGQRLARVERSVRIATIRGLGVRVVDWEWDQPLAVALARARRGWSR